MKIVVDPDITVAELTNAASACDSVLLRIGNTSNYRLVPKGKAKAMLQQPTRTDNVVTFPGR